VKRQIQQCKIVKCLKSRGEKSRFSKQCYWETTSCTPVPVSLKQDGSASLATWHVQILEKIITELSVCRSIHQDIGGDLEGTRVPPARGGLMPMYNQLTSVSTQLGGRPTTVFSGDVSSTRRHFIRGMAVKKKLLALERQSRQINKDEDKVHWLITRLA